ncbi:MAG TPA: hypothetical protein VH373_12070 [Jatrophihabitantaceae bacterium]|jgi:hypothetical protein
MASGPFDEPPTPLTARERQVIAALEVDFKRDHAVRQARRRTALRTLAVVGALVVIAAGGSVAVAILTPPAAAMTAIGLVCTAAAAGATALVLSRR